MVERDNGGLTAHDRLGWARYDDSRNELAVLDGIMCLRWLDEAVTEASAIAAKSGIGELSAGRVYPLLVELRGIQKVEYRAQKAFAAGPWPVNRVAIVTDLPVDRIAATFYLTRHPPRCPAGLFETANEAVSWLRCTAGQDDALP